MFSKQNTRSYWSWQGNNLGWSFWYSIIGIALIFFILMLLWIFKDRIRNYWDKKSSYLFIFKKEVYLWRLVGVFILTLQIIRALVLSNYVRQWEIWLPIHLCRLHILLIALALIAGKIKWIKYLAIMAFIGALFGVGLANLHVKKDDIANNYSKNLTLTMLNTKGYTFYELGPDTFVFQEFFFTHILIATMPTFIWIVHRQKLSLKHFWFTQVGYFGVLILLWSFNWAASSISSDSWKANAWYVGPDKQNDYKNVLGWLSHWPQNLFTYSFLVGTPLMWIVYFSMYFFGNLVWFKNKKIVQFKRADEWLENKKDWKEFFNKSKNIFKNRRKS